jgi:hypothetical protein
LEGGEQVERSGGFLLLGRTYWVEREEPAAEVRDEAEEGCDVDWIGRRGRVRMVESVKKKGCELLEL